MLAARDAKARIRSVRSIDQICRAMKTVASIRLRRAEHRLQSAEPYRRALAGAVGRLAGVAASTAGVHEPTRLAAGQHPFLQVRQTGRILVVLVTSDRGLCGGYNASAVRRALSLGGPEEVEAVAVGRRGQAQMARRGYRVVERLVPLGGEPETQALRRLADRVGQLYAAGAFRQVLVVFTRFLGGARSEVRADPLLPLAAEAVEEPDIILEPVLPALLPGLLGRWLRSELGGMILESVASEHAARVAAMTAATENAEEMMQDLTLAYNKARQAAITKELTEIVGAGEAAA